MKRNKLSYKTIKYFASMADVSLKLILKFRTSESFFLNPLRTQNLT